MCSCSNSISAEYLLLARAIPNTGRLYINNGYLRVTRITHLSFTSCNQSPKRNLSETLSVWRHFLPYTKSSSNFLRSSIDTKKRPIWAGGNSTRLFTNPPTASPLPFTASQPKQKHSREKSRQLRWLMIYKTGERMREFLGAFLIKQLFHSRLLDMRWLYISIISYPTSAHGIISN